MITTNYNSKEGILEVTYDGDISIEEVLDYIKVSEFDEKNPGILKILSDCRTARFKTIPNDISRIVEEANILTNYHTFIFDALVVQDPLDTALTMLYEKFSPPEKYMVKVFYTIENARLWLKSFDI